MWFFVSEGVFDGVTGYTYDDCKRDIESYMKGEPSTHSLLSRTMENGRPAMGGILNRTKIFIVDNGKFVRRDLNIVMLTKTLLRVGHLQSSKRQEQKVIIKLK